MTTLLNALVNDRKHGKLTRIRMIRLPSALLRARKSINLDTGDQLRDRAFAQAVPLLQQIADRRRLSWIGAGAIQAAAIRRCLAINVDRL